MNRLKRLDQAARIIHGRCESEKQKAGAVVCTGPGLN